MYRGGESTRSFMIIHSVMDIGDFLRGDLIKEQPKIEKDSSSGDAGSGSK
jgi:hypothetical protein